jgi:acyl phosphate:glycerol-3-phosphate acyltransferase
MTLSGTDLAAIVVSYLVGSLSFAVIVSRFIGLADPRTYGSKNPGATNVLRSGHKAAAILTLLMDALKGWLPVWVAHSVLGLSATAVALVGLAAFVGHLWPVFFGFQGGKGVATAAGVLFGLNAWLGVATLASFAIIVVFFRYVSLASIVAAAFAPFFMALQQGLTFAVMAVAAMGALLVWRHQANIGRLLQGTESKLGQGKSSSKIG